jgi:hypothetical protein
MPVSISTHLGEVDLVESADGVHSSRAVLSDQISFSAALGVYIFASDADPAFAAPPATVDCTVFTCIAETGVPQDVSSYFGLTSAKILVVSDAEPIPEPASILLLGLGLAALRCTRGKKD